jgi:hypothetical protein
MEDTYNDTLLKLNKKVDQVTNSDNPVVLKSKSIFNLNINSPFLYFIIPISIMILLFLCKPNFVMFDVDGKIEKKVSLKKIFVSTVIISLIIAIIYFGYSYKQKQKSTKE